MINVKFEVRIRILYDDIGPVDDIGPFFFRKENCYQQSTKIRCPPPIKACSYINTCAGVTAGTWAAHLKDCMIELHNTSRNPSETNLYPQEPYQHVTAKQKLHQATTVILRLDFTYYKMMNAQILQRSAIFNFS